MPLAGQGELFLGQESAASCGVGSDFDAMRQTAVAMMQAGMLGDHFAVEAAALPPEQLPERYQLIIDAVCANAVRAAGEVLALAGKETVSAIVDEVLTLNVEVVGPSAKNLSPSIFQRKFEPRFSGRAEISCKSLRGIIANCQLSEVR